MPALSVTSTATGPLLEGVAATLVQQVLEDAVREVTELGMQRLTSAFPTGLPVKTGNLRRNVSPVIYGPRAEINDGGVIYSSWIEGTSSRNETTRFKGYSTWRRTIQHLQDEVVPEVASKAAERLVKELGG